MVTKITYQFHMPSVMVTTLTRVNLSMPIRHVTTLSYVQLRTCMSSPIVTTLTCVKLF